MADMSAVFTMAWSSISSNCGGGEDLGQTHEHHDKGDHGHADDIVTDGCSNLQPAAIVSNQKEEVLKQNNFFILYELAKAISALVKTLLVCNWILSPCQLHKVTSGQAED